VLGLHFAQVFCVSSVYPTAIRALGIGLFMLFARGGGTLGPSLVSALLARQVPVGTLFKLATIPLGIGAVASIAITVLYRRHFRVRNPDASELVSSPARLGSDTQGGV
jgi:hypothetical protein